MQELPLDNRHLGEVAPSHREAVEEQLLSRQGEELQVDSQPGVEQLQPEEEPRPEELQLVGEEEQLLELSQDRETPW